jgi:hypothetical protein
MSNKEEESIQLLQGTLDFIVLRTLASSVGLPCLHQMPGDLQRSRVAAQP